MVGLEGGDASSELGDLGDIIEDLRLLVLLVGLLELLLGDLGLMELLLVFIIESFLGLFLFGFFEFCDGGVEDGVSVAEKFSLEFIFLDGVFLGHFFEIFWVNLSGVVGDLAILFPVFAFEGGDKTEVSGEGINVVDSIRGVEISEDEG